MAGFCAANAQNKSKLTDDQKLEVLHERLKGNGPKFQTLYALMNIYERKKNNAKACEYAEQAAALAQNSDELRLCGHGLIRLGYNKKAMQLFRKAAEIDPKNPSCYIDQSYVSREMKDYPTALSAASKAVELAPNMIEAFYHRSHTYLAMNRPADAKRDLERIIALKGKKDKFLYLTLGLAEVQMGDTKSAEKHLKKALELDNSMMDPHQLLANMYERAGRYEEAIHEFDEWIRLQSDDSEGNAKVLLRRADSEVHNGQPVDSILSLTSATKLCPISIHYYLRANHLIREGRWEAAERDCTTAIAIAPTPEVRILKLRADCYRKLDRPEEAVKDLTACIKLKPEGDLFQRRYKVLVSQGKNEEALQDINEAIKLRGKTGDYYFLRGEVLNKLGEHQKALKDYDLAIQLEPTDERFPTARDRTYELLNASRKKQP